jgi:hypothetical protein
VRVTEFSIIEVYGASGPRTAGRAEAATCLASGSAAWSENLETREAARWILARYRRERTARLAAAYIGFLAIAAAVIWFLVR